MSKNESIKQTADKILSGAKTRGIKDIKVVVGRSRSVSVTYRKGRPDKIEESSKRSISLHLYDNGKYSVSSSNDFREDALENFLDSAVALTKAMAPDSYRELTAPSLYQDRKTLDLELYDPKVSAFSAAKQNEMAALAEAAALEAAGDKAISAEASMDIGESSRYQIHSNGFEGEAKGTQLWLFAELALMDNDKRPSGWDVTGSRHLNFLADAKSVGKGAWIRASHKLGQKKIETRKCPMIVENRTASRLLGGLLGALSGRALQQKRSFLEDMKNEKIATEKLTITDDPFIVRGFGSRLFDGEGISAKKMPVIQNGILKNYYIDTYYGKKLEMTPTSGDSSNLIVSPGDLSLAELISSMDNGILVRGFIGGNVNSTTGDFSLGVYGTLIENGELTIPVSELNIAGNHKDLWNRLVALGNDPWMYSSSRIPSLVFDSIQFSGN